MQDRLTEEQKEQAVHQIADAFFAKIHYKKALLQIVLEENVDAMRDIEYRDLKVGLSGSRRMAEHGTFVQCAMIKEKWDFIGKIAQQYKKYIQDDKNDEANFGQALNIAVMENRMKAAKELIDAGAGKLAKGDILFRMALKNRCERMVDLLLSYDFELRIKDKKTLIELASERDDWDSVEAIATHQKTDPDDKAGYGYILLDALCNNRIETAKLLLEAGASKHSRGPYSGDTALHKAVRQNNVAMVKLLLSFGCDLTLENADKKTPIQLAVKLKYWDMVDVIAKEQKTDLDKARYGAVLHDAVVANRSETVKLLLETGAKEGLEEKPKESQSRQECCPVKTLMNNFFGLFYHSPPQDFMGVLENKLKNNCRI